MAIDQIGPFTYQRFAPVLPTLGPGGDESARHAVLIAGGGPVGLAVALGLAHWGVRSVVLEADDSVCEGSRAACISRRSLEIVERLGASRAFLDKGLAWTSGTSYYGTEQVYRLEMPSSAGDKYPPMINLEQYYIEQFLLDQINALNARQPGMVDLRWQNRVSRLSHDAHGVALEVTTPQGDYRCAADWLIACDGGQSFVRASLGLELKGVGYTGRYAIVDIELASTAPTERRAWFDPPWARGTTILMHRQPDDIWRVDYQLAAGEDAEKVLSPDEVRRFVQTHLDAIGEGHLSWTPVWSSLYRAGAMTLDSYRHGRILFAGNSAHAMPIFGVRGLNSGFDDADNLIWKLATHLRGQAGDALLDSYSRERVQAFHINAASAMRSTEFMSPPNRGFELMREAALSLGARHPGIARLVNPRQTQAVSYDDSPLSSPGDVFATGPAPGAPLPEVALEGGGHLSDRLHARAFTVLVFGDGPRLHPAPQADQPDCAVERLPAPGAAASALGARDGSVYLIRPDGHVAARWHATDAATVQAAVRRACQLA